MHNGRTSLTQFIIEEQRHIKDATGDFTSLLNDVVTACKVISDLVNHGALVGVLGAAGSENVQGEDQKKMDIISNDVFLKSNEWAGHLAAMAEIAPDRFSGLQIPHDQASVLRAGDREPFVRAECCGGHSACVSVEAIDLSATVRVPQPDGSAQCAREGQSPIPAESDGRDGFGVAHEATYKPICALLLRAVLCDVQQPQVIVGRAA